MWKQRLDGNGTRSRSGSRSSRRASIVYTEEITPLIQACVDGNVDEVKRLVKEENASVTEKSNTQGRTALHFAAEHCASVSHQFTMEFLIEQGNPVNFPRGGSGAVNKDPIHLAAENGCTLAILTLTTHGADILSQDSKGRTPLLSAVLNGKMGTLKKLCQQEEINFKRRLWKICFAGKYVLSEQGRVDLKAKIDALCKEKSAFLIDLIVNHLRVVVNELLSETDQTLCAEDKVVLSNMLSELAEVEQVKLNRLSVGSLRFVFKSLTGDPEKIDLCADDIVRIRNATTNLCGQQQRSFSEMNIADLKQLLRDLCDHHAGVICKPDRPKVFAITDALDMPDNEGVYPLQFAVKKGYALTVAELIKCGALASRLDAEQNTLLHIAAKAGSVEVVKVLLEYLDANATNKAGQTALHLATLGNHSRVISLLHQQPGINPNPIDASGKGPLHLAVEQLHSDVEKYNADGLRALADQPRTNMSHRSDTVPTPAHLAAEYDVEEALEILLGLEEDPEQDGVVLERAAGRANPNARDNYGDTPLHSAAREASVKAVQILSRSSLVEVNAINESKETALDLADELSEEEEAEAITKTLRAVGGKKYKEIPKEERQKLKQDLKRAMQSPEASAVSSEEDDDAVLQQLEAAKARIASLVAEPSPPSEAVIEDAVYFDEEDAEEQESSDEASSERDLAVPAAEATHEWTEDAIFDAIMAQAAAEEDPPSPPSETSPPQLHAKPPIDIFLDDEDHETSSEGSVEIETPASAMSSVAGEEVVASPGKVSLDHTDQILIEATSKASFVAEFLDGEPGQKDEASEIEQDEVDVEELFAALNLTATIFPELDQEEALPEPETPKLRQRDTVMIENGKIADLIGDLSLMPVQKVVSPHTVFLQRPASQIKSTAPRELSEHDTCTIFLDIDMLEHPQDYRFVVGSKEIAGDRFKAMCVFTAYAKAESCKAPILASPLDFYAGSDQRMHLVCKNAEMFNAIFERHKYYFNEENPTAMFSLLQKDNTIVFPRTYGSCVKAFWLDVVREFNLKIANRSREVVQDSSNPFDFKVHWLNHEKILKHLQLNHNRITSGSNGFSPHHK